MSQAVEGAIRPTVSREQLMADLRAAMARSLDRLIDDHARRHTDTALLEGSEAITSVDLEIVKAAVTPIPTLRTAISPAVLTDAAASPGVGLVQSLADQDVLACAVEASLTAATGIAIEPARITSGGEIIATATSGGMRAGIRVNAQSMAVVIDVDGVADRVACTDISDRIVTELTERGLPVHVTVAERRALGDAVMDVARRQGGRLRQQRTDDALRIQITPDTNITRRS